MSRSDISNLNKALCAINEAELAIEDMDERGDAEAQALSHLEEAESWLRDQVETLEREENEEE